MMVFSRMANRFQLSSFSEGIASDCARCVLESQPYVSLIVFAVRVLDTQGRQSFLEKFAAKGCHPCSMKVATS